MACDESATEFVAVGIAFCGAGHGPGNAKDDRDQSAEAPTGSPPLASLPCGPVGLQACRWAGAAFGSVGVTDGGDPKTPPAVTPVTARCERRVPGILPDNRTPPRLSSTVPSRSEIRTTFFFFPHGPPVRHHPRGRIRPESSGGVHAQGRTHPAESMFCSSPTPSSREARFVCPRQDHLKKIRP